MSILTFGRFEVFRGDSEDPRDLNIYVTGFEFDTPEPDDTRTSTDLVLEILDYIKGKIS